MLQAGEVKGLKEVKGLNTSLTRRVPLRLFHSVSFYISDI